MTATIFEALSFVPPQLLIKKFCREYNVSENEAAIRFEETKKFLVLCATNRKTSYSPSKSIDEMWHQFILHSRAYLDFCNKAGMFLHHEPSESSDGEMYQRTLKDMKHLYGTLDSKYWEDQVSANCCGSCSSCSSSS